MLALEGMPPGIPGEGQSRGDSLAPLIGWPPEGLRKANGKGKESRIPPDVGGRNSGGSGRGKEEGEEVLGDEFGLRNGLSAKAFCERAAERRPLIAFGERALCFDPEGSSSGCA